MSFGGTTTVTITLPRKQRSQTYVQSTWQHKTNYQSGKVATNFNSAEMPIKRNKCHVEKCHQFLKFFVVLTGALFVRFVKRIFLFCGILVHCFYPDGELPKLYYKPSVMHDHILKNCRALTSEYRCTPWGNFGWIQSLSNLVTKLLLYENSYRRKVLLTKDGGLVGIDWYHKSPSKRSNTRPVLLIVPCRHFVSLSEHTISEQACKAGFRPVVFRRRGSAGISLRDTSKYQTFGDSSDFREVVKYLKQMDSKAKLVSLGVGSGAGLLLSYLGEYGSSCHLNSVVCLSPWYSIEDQFSHQKRQSFSQWLYLQSMKWELYESARVLQDKIDLDKAFASSSLPEYIENILCSNDGSYKNLDEFYEKDELLRDIDEVAIPLLCVNSLDDPIVKGEDIPFDLFETLPHVMLATTRRGGHGAFLHGWRVKNWGIDLALNYFQTILKVMKRPELTTANITKNSTNNKYSDDR